MSKKAVAYVNRLGLTDETARRVFLLLAERTNTSRHSWDTEIPEIMGLELTPADIPGLAAQAGLDPEGFRTQLRGLKQHVRMDFLEHSDGVWEIVYGRRRRSAPSHFCRSPTPTPRTWRGQSPLHYPTDERIA